ncbi:MAG: hypothetical protein ACERKV_12975 [Clostridiaceae bacterium]
MQDTNEKLLDIITDASYRLHTEIKKAYKNDNFKAYLSSVGMLDIFPCEEEPPLYDTNPGGKILIIGDAKIKDKEIYGCLKEYGIDKDRVELHIGYDEAKNYSFNKIQYNSNYRLILFGSVPHSGKGKQDKSSIITQIESTDGYPKVIRLSDGHGLKLTKTSLKNAVNQEIQRGYLVA